MLHLEKFLIVAVAAVFAICENTSSFRIHTFYVTDIGSNLVTLPWKIIPNLRALTVSIYS